MLLHKQAQLQQSFLVHYTPKSSNNKPASCWTDEYDSTSSATHVTADMQSIIQHLLKFICLDYNDTVYKLFQKYEFR